MGKDGHSTEKRATCWFAWQRPQTGASRDTYTAKNEVVFVPLFTPA